MPLARTFQNKRILSKWVFEGLNELTSSKKKDDGPLNSFKKYKNDFKCCKIKKKKVKNKGCRWRGPLKIRAYWVNECLRD